MRFKVGKRKQGSLRFASGGSDCSSGMTTVHEQDELVQGPPARLQMRREALCAFGISIQHQVAPAAAAIRQVKYKSSTVSLDQPTRHTLIRRGGAITRRGDRCES